MDAVTIVVLLLVSIYWLVLYILNWRKRKIIEKANDYARKNIKRLYLDDFENREMTDKDFREIMTQIFLGEIETDNAKAMNEIIEKLF